MDFYFNLVIFLILEVVFVRSIDNDSLKTNLYKVQLSAGIATNPFLQSSMNRPTTQNNRFLHPSNNNPFLSTNRQESQVSDIVFPDYNYNLITNSNGNPFLNSTKTNSKIEESPSSPSSITQPSTSEFNTPIPDNDFTSYTPSPPTIHPPISRTPSLEELLPLKINPGKTISELKCEEYIKEIAGTTLITTLTGISSGVRRVTNTCGNNANRLVVGGTEARIGEFPHMVALGTRNSNQFVLMCGGTLISHSWVLSAAHCTFGPSGGPTHARIGFHSLTDQNDDIFIKDIKSHPDYKPPAMYADIALIQLEKPVTFNKFIRPACLYQQYDTVPRQAWVSGWGVIGWDEEVSDRLQKAKLELIDNLTCTLRHNSSTEVPYGITTSMICAGDPKGNWTKDTCQGDSGGPLQIVQPKSECLFQVIGITSFGQGCAMINIPGVYTRVSHYVRWIEDNVWPQGQ